MKHVVTILGLLWLALPVAAQTSDAAASGQKGGIGQERITEGLTTGPRRPEFPLQIGGALFGDGDLKMVLVNLTNQDVEQVTVGVLLEDKTAPAPVTRMGKVCLAHVPPNGFLLVTTPNTGYDAAAAYFRTKGITDREVSVGIAQVRFADGTEWSYPLEAQGRFEGDSDPAVMKKMDSLAAKAFGRDSGGHVSFVSLLVDASPEKKVSVCRQ